MTDFQFEFDPDVDVLPGLKYDVNEGLLADVIRDALDEHYLCVDEVVREQNGFQFRLLQPDAHMMVDTVHGFTVNGENLTYFYLVSTTTEIAGKSAKWKITAMNESEWEEYVNSARQSPPTHLI